MKKTSIFLASMALLAASCAKEDLKEMSQNQDTITIKADVPATDSKTTISDNGDKTWSVLWAADDAISVNGQSSNSISLSDDRKSAEFTLPVIDAPYKAIYPASSAASAEKLTIPATQNYVEGSIDPSSAIMLAYSETASQALAFHHAMAYLKINVQGTTDTDNIRSIRVSGNNNETMHGEFNLAFSDAPSMESAEPAANNSIIYDCGTEGVAQGKDLFIAIPARDYANGLTLTIIDSQNHYQSVHSYNPFSAVAGKIFPTSITFNPQGTYIQGGIYTVEDWNAFVTAVNNSDYSAWVSEVDGEEGVHLMADIFSSTNLKRTMDKDKDNGKKVEWDGTFYGHGHTITHNAIEPLFLHIGTTGVVKDLIVAGTRTSNANNNWPGSIALNNAGQIRNCTNKVNVKLSGKYTQACGICRTNTGTVTDCVNEGSISISEPTAAVLAAGVVLYSSGTIARCTNKAAISVTGVDQNCVVGGVAHSLSGTTVQNLSNEGALSIEASLTAARTIFMGGVTALANYDNKGAKVLQCSNSGDLKIVKTGNFHMVGGAIGGIAGAIELGASSTEGEGVTFSTIDGCWNSGRISFKETDRPSKDDAYAIGGILGRCGVYSTEGYFDVAKGWYTVIRNSCFNTGTIDVYTDNGQSMNVGNSGARQTYVGAIAGYVNGGSSTAVVRGNKENKTCTILVGSKSGGICAGGILGGGGKVNIDGTSCANVTFGPSEVQAPVKLGYVGAVIGWGVQTVSVTSTKAVASFNFDSPLKSANYASGFGGIATGKTMTIAKSSVTYQGQTVTADDIYGSGTKTIK
ncbi:MAG: fimbrillin family protein [Rikenellaceae bacterium]|nr:fimbrillin family protein [Rikenellaceae bacterium]